MIPWEEESLITSSSMSKWKGGRNAFCKEWLIPLWTKFFSRLEQGGIAPTPTKWCKFLELLISYKMISSLLGVSSIYEKYSPS